MLGTAFAVGMLKNLARVGALLSFDHTRAEVDVVLHRQYVPSRFTEITCELLDATDEGQRRVDLMHTNLRNFATVYNTLPEARAW